MIIEGRLKKEVKSIYNTSDKHFISEQSNNTAVSDNLIKNYVYVDDKSGEALGYIAIYENTDFVQKEEFDVTLSNIKNNSVYIWEIGTKKGHERKGIASMLVEHVLNVYKKSDIYSCVEQENIASVKIHEKFGFKPVAKFEDNFFGRSEEEYIIFELKRN